MLLILGCLLSASAQQTAASPPAAVAARSLQFNGRDLRADELAVLEQLEALYGTRLPDGAWWYDPLCGAIGQWGGPALGIIPAGLSLGGPVPAEASGGTTGVFFNGRQLHAADLAGLTALIGPVQPGRYFLDAQGNAGPEGGPILVNLYLLMQAAASASSGGTIGTDHTRSTIVPGIGGMVCTGAGDCSSITW